MKELTRVGAEQIYRTGYWTPTHCDSLPWPASLVVFDAAVNQGLGFALRLTDVAVLSTDAALLLRIRRYAHIAKVNSSEHDYILGWVDRILKVQDFIEANP